MILPFLKSAQESQRQIAAMALERTNPDMHEVLFDSLKPYEAEYSRKGKAKPADKTRLRAIVSLIYSSVAERLRQGTLVRNESLRKTFLAFIQETLQFLSQPDNETVFDTLRFLRYHFTVIVRSVAQDLQQGDELLDKTLRRDLFVLLAKWSRGEDLLKEPENRKKLVTCSSKCGLTHLCVSECYDTTNEGTE